MSKSPRYKIVVNGHQKFTGRLIGFIDDEECKAILNVPDAARKISTAEGINKSEISNQVLSRKRFVVVTEDLSEKGFREIYISPKIRHLYVAGRKKGLKCFDNKEYSFEDD